MKFDVNRIITESIMETLAGEQFPNTVKDTGSKAKNFLIPQYDFKRNRILPRGPEDSTPPPESFSVPDPHYYRENQHQDHIGSTLTETVSPEEDRTSSVGAYHGPGHEHDILPHKPPPELGIKDQLYQAGSKAFQAAKKSGSEAIDYIKKHPELSAATAAGLAAGVGGLAAIRKMRKMQKANK